MTLAAVIGSFRLCRNALPRGSRAYLFGSVLRSDAYQDVDVLIVYCARETAPATACDAHRPFLTRWQASLERPLHLVLLHEAELTEGVLDDLELRPL